MKYITIFLLIHSFSSMAQNIDNKLNKLLTDNKIEKARARFQKIYTDTVLADYHFVKGWIERKAGNYSNAIAHLEKCIQIDPKYAQAYSELGVANYIMNGDHVIGVRYIQKGLDLDSTNSWILSHMGALYYSEDKFKTAKTYLSKAIKYDPTSDNSMFNLGLCYLKLKQYPAAIIAISRAIKIEKDPMYYYNRAICYYEIDDYKRALKDFRKADKGYQTENPYEKLSKENIRTYIESCKELMRLK